MIERRLLLATGLHYNLLEWDGGGEHTVVLLHGFLDHAWGWEATVEAGLGDGLHVIAPDLRGHGDSDRVGPGGYYHFPDHVADVHSLVAQLGRRRVSLVGHSMGGSVAAYFAGTFPERVYRLAILEGLGVPQTTASAPARTRAWVDAWERVRAKPPKRYASVADAAARLREHDPLLDDALALRLAERGTIELPDGGRRFKHDPLYATPGPLGFAVALAEEYWRGVGCPVLLVSGGESRFMLAPDEQERRMASFAAARRAVLPGAGHMMQRHQPRALAGVLREFLVGEARAEQ
jgi:pimeloyl-ACP methyl ester carboxylesterase